MNSAGNHDRCLGLIPFSPSSPASEHRACTPSRRLTDEVACLDCDAPLRPAWSGGGECVGLWSPSTLNRRRWRSGGLGRGSREPSPDTGALHRVYDAIEERGPRPLSVGRGRNRGGVRIRPSAFDEGRLRAKGVAGARDLEI